MPRADMHPYVYLATNTYQITREFGYSGNGTIITGDRASSEIILWKHSTIQVEAIDARAFGLGGWSLNVRHLLDWYGRVLHYGDGRVRYLNSEASRTIATLPIAGSANKPRSVAASANGTLYVANNVGGGYKIMAYPPSGGVSVWASPSWAGTGTSIAGPTGGSELEVGDSGSCQAALGQPVQVASMVVAQDGSIFAVTGTSSGARVRRFYQPSAGAAWLVETIAGTGTTTAPCTGSCNGELGRRVLVNNFAQLTLGRDGAVYLTDLVAGTANGTGGVLRRFVQDKQRPQSEWLCGHPPWIASTVAGLGSQTYAAGTRLIGVNAKFLGNYGTLYAPVAAPDGTIFFASDGLWPTIWALEPAGLLRVVAGNRLAGTGGDGGLAVNASLRAVRGLAWHEGYLYLSDRDASTIRVIDPQGVIRAVTKPLGALAAPAPGELPAQAGVVWQPNDISIAGDGSLVITDEGHSLVRAIRPPGVLGCTGAFSCIPSEDGQEVFGFDADGKHLWTKASVGGSTNAKYQFNYSGTTLISIDTSTGLRTNVTTNGSQVVLAAPFGQNTTLTLTDGYVSQILFAGLGGATTYGWSMTYKANAPGLLETLTYNYNTSTFGYDGLGRLIYDLAPTHSGNATTLSTQRLPLGRQVNLTSPGRRTSQAKIESSPSGGTVSTFIPASGISRVTTKDARGQTTFTDLGGSYTSSFEPGSAGPRFGMVAPENSTERTTIVGNGHQPTVSSVVTRSTLSATLSNAADVLSVTALNQNTSVGGTIGASAQPYADWARTTTVNATSKVTRTTSPAVSGWSVRQTERTSDLKQRTSQLRVGKSSLPLTACTLVQPCVTTNVTYNDAACPGSAGCGGRATTIETSAPGESTRTTTLKYEYAADNGYPSAIVGPEGSRTTFGTVTWNATLSKWELSATGRDGFGRPNTITHTQDIATGMHPVFTAGVGLNPDWILSSVTPPGRTAHIENRDGLNLLSSYIPPDTTPPLTYRDTIYQFDFDRRLVAVHKPWDAAKGDVIFGHDSAGRVRTVFDSVAGTTATMSYDASTGQRSLMSVAGNGSTVESSFGYAGNLPIQETFSEVTGAATAGAVLRRQYDHLLRPTTISVGLLSTSLIDSNVTYALDEEVSSVRLPSSGAALRQLNHVTRDWLGRTTFATVADGTAAVSLKESRAYNGYGEPKTYGVCAGGTDNVCSGTGGTNFYRITASTRDNLGRLTSITEDVAGVGSAPVGAQTSTFAYDEAGRLKAVTGPNPGTYSYDANGNRISNNGYVWDYDAQDRLTKTRQASPAVIDYAYKDNGTLKSSTGATYSYDLRGNLMSASGSVAVSYLSDAGNRRVKKVTSAGTRRWLYDGALRPVAEFDVQAGNSRLTHVYAYGDHPHVPDLVYQPLAGAGAGRTYRIVSDFRGSVRLVIDTSTSPPTVRQRIDYDAWGNATEWVNAVGDTAFQPVSLGFAGGIWDRDTGLVRFGARDYDPRIGRWTSKDPSRFGGGWNLYAYAHNDPVNFIDPDGETPFAAVGALGGGGAVTSGGWVAASGPAGVLAAGAVAWAVLPGQVSALADEWDSDAFWGRGNFAKPEAYFAEHEKNARPSTEEKHEKGQARKSRDKGGEKGDERRKYRRGNGKKKKGGGFWFPGDWDDSSDEACP